MGRIAISELGRIGRAGLKIILNNPQLTVEAINDLSSLENLAYFLRYDTVDGRYEKPVESGPERLVVVGQSIKALR